jgi:hypothetical protein
MSRKIRDKTRFLHLFFCYAENWYMPAMGYTVSELAELTGKTRHAVESWLSDHKIKPLSYEAIYPPDTLDKIREVKRGRPRKAAAPEAKTKPAPVKIRPRKTAEPEPSPEPAKRRTEKSEK